MHNLDLVSDRKGGHMDFTPRVNDDNPDPRVACALLLDTSGSMEGERIRAMNEGFELFCSEIKADPLAQKRTEVAVISFGGTARVEIPFTEGRNLQPRSFSASGGTPLGAALDLALDELAAQKSAYKQSGLEYYRPWLFVITDGSPTDGPTFDAAAARVKAAEIAKGVTVFSVLVEGGDRNQLRRLSDEREPLDLRSTTSFRELFAWLSASMRVVSNSSTFGRSDSGVTQAEATDQNALPSPAGWAKW